MDFVGLRDENLSASSFHSRYLPTVKNKNIPKPHENTPTLHTYWFLLRCLLRRSSRHNPTVIGTPKLRRIVGAHPETSARCRDKKNYDARHVQHSTPSRVEIPSSLL